MKPLLDDHDSEELDDRTDLVPLIDCIFLVLLFYVVVSTFSEEAAFPLQLPRVSESKQTSQVATAKELITLSVSADGTYALDKNVVPPLELGRALRERIATDKPRTLIIRGDRLAPYEKIAAALETVQSFDIEEVSLVVEKAP
ncbi:MAG: biopolymer transporter ExbD [Opitutaceae bacterium]|nr:biopolymer transporter ExbD [Opitutaceae bacterium]